MATGQIFSKTTQALFYNYKQLPIQRMLDFDFLCGRETPSAAGIINPGSDGFQKLFFGQEEIAIPVHPTIEAACNAHPTADVFINFASFRSAAASSMAALKQPTIRVVAIIAEGVPESNTKQLISYARANNKVVPYGKMEAIAREEFGLPATDMGLKYLEYNVTAEESTLLKMLGPDHMHPIIQLLKKFY